MNKTTGAFSALLLGVSMLYGQDVRTAALDALLTRAAETHSEAVIIYKDNTLVAERYFGIGRPDVKIEAMSCTKSIVGLAVACLMTDGLIRSLDTPVSEFYPEWRQGRKRDITIRHLVNMTSGIQNDPNAGVEIYPSPDFVQLALAAELTSNPGEVWSYNNKALNLMAGVIRKISGLRMDLYIGERLFKPLGITDFTWSLDDAGNPHVMSGCQIKPADFAKIGLLLLNKGKFNGRQIIAEDRALEVVVPCVSYKGYGMLWWLDYSRTVSVVDDEIVKDLTEAGVPGDFIAKVAAIKGRYDSDEDYTARVVSLFGPNPWARITETLAPRGLRMRRKEFSGNVSYRADGYLGNYLIVDPNMGVVAVRMISHQSHKDGADDFGDFRKMVLDLAPKDAGPRSDPR